jgi:hypothetical protein
LTQVREVAPVTGYLSQSDPRAHFGLGPDIAGCTVEVRWPDGTKTLHEDVSSNQMLTVIQDDP